MTTCRVLVVDDEPLVLASYSRILIRHGYDTLSANCARQAFEIIQSHSPVNVVLSDVELPGMCGRALVHEIGGQFPGTACVLMTGSLAGSVELPPGVPLLRKPLSRRDLIASVEDAISRSVKLRANLRDSIARSAALQLESEQLRNECREVWEQSQSIGQKFRLLRELRQKNPKQ